MVDIVIVMFAIMGFIVLVVVLSLVQNHYKVFSRLTGWYLKQTHPEEVSKTVSGHLIRVVQGSVEEEYKLAKAILGKGTSGVCRIGIHNNSKKKYAIKVIELKDENVTQFYKREIDILKDLEHLNIIRVFEAYEQVGSLGLVMELCNGGHLGEVIADTPNGRLDESHAQRYICQLVGALAHCHQHGIAHRDVKLQNVLLENRTFDAQVKLIDFGGARRFSVTDRDEDKPLFRTVVGTTYTMAPEVFKKEYDERCDVWSLGVVAFIMLCGHKPFESIDLPNHQDVAKSSLVSNIMMGRYSFQHPAWEFISEEAMMFIMTCFTMNFRKRPSSSQLFQDPWCAPHNINSKLSDTKLKAFTRTLSRIPSQSLSQTSMIAVAFSMPTTEARDLRTMFQSIDRDGSGKVDREEFCSYLQVAEPKMTKDDMNLLFNAIDQDENQEISFLEFVASMVDSRTVNVREINQAFNLLDQEKKGYISYKDLYRLLAANHSTSPLHFPTTSGVTQSPLSSSTSCDVSAESVSSQNTLSKIALLSFPSFFGGTAKEAPEPCVPLSDRSSEKKNHKSKSGKLTAINSLTPQQSTVGDSMMPQQLPQDLEIARLKNLQQKVKDIINEADQDGDGRISYAEFLLAMASGSAPIIPAAPPSLTNSPCQLARNQQPREMRTSMNFENYDPQKLMLLKSFSDDPAPFVSRPVSHDGSVQLNV